MKPQKVKMLLGGKNLCQHLPLRANVYLYASISSAESLLFFKLLKILSKTRRSFDRNMNSGTNGTWKKYMYLKTAKQRQKSDKYKVSYIGMPSEPSK